MTAKMPFQNFLLLLKGIQSEMLFPLEDKFDLDFVIPILHRLYFLTPSSIRATLLEILLRIELLSDESIVLKYRLDCLVTLTLGIKPQPNMSLTPQEIASAFCFVASLIKIRHILPLTILRAMIALYQFNKEENGKLIIGFLSEAVLYQPELFQVPDVMLIFSEQILSPRHLTVSLLLSRSISPKNPKFQPSILMASLIRPFVSEESYTLEDIDQSIISTISLFRTWPGLIGIGINRMLLADFVRCIPFHSEPIIRFLKDLLSLDRPSDLVDGYTGYIFWNLIKINLINSLARCDDSYSQAFMTELLPFRGSAFNIEYDIETPLRKRAMLEISEDTNLLIYKFSQTCLSHYTVKKLSDVQLTKQLSTWDWFGIKRILSVILLLNEELAISQEALAFLQTLLTSITQNFQSGEHKNIMDIFLDVAELLNSIPTLSETFVFPEFMISTFNTSVTYFVSASSVIKVSWNGLYSGS